MRWSSRFRVLAPVVALLFLTGLSTASCGGAADDPNAPIAITVSQTYLTVANKTGSAIASGLVELVPSGVLAPYRTNLPRIESGQSRDVQFDQFSGVGGARFRRGVTRIKAIRVTATDMAGNTHKREVPFN
jgi:hypothetical protein